MKAVKVNNKDFFDFIDTSEEDSGVSKRLSFAGIIPYNELNYAPNTLGYHQAMDRVEFTIENWHSYICSHPSFKNPSPEMDKVRELLVEAADSIFQVYNELGNIQFKRSIEEDTPNKESSSYTKLGVH